MSRVRSAVEELGIPLAGIAAAIGLWAVIAAMTTTSALPSPLVVAQSFADGVADGTIPTAAGKTLVRLVFSFAVSVGVGTAIGVGLALSSFARRAVRPLIVALQITPFVAWVPLAVIWFGPSERAVVFVAIVGSFPSLTLATISAFRQVPPLLVRAGRTLGADGWELYRSVIFPAALPGYMGGLQQAWGFAWKALMAGELIVAATRATGLGHLLARSSGGVSGLLAVLAVIVVIGVAVDYLVFGLTERRIRVRRGLSAPG
jgi:NitT/TauT family transport system permease protein